MSSKKSSDGGKREVSVSGMSFLRGSASYVWCTTSVLGKGATGAVYQGVNRHTGEAVAVKTFNQMSHMRPQEVQMREFEVLKKVNHRNIVKLLAIEEEQETRGKVIVMELCTGGSLFNILDDPENSYGLEEKEFLLVLHHLAAGMKHLRDNNLVHRDLKPGNIMRFVGLDGSTLYKLTDFGAARELGEDQEFMSLYGTEEYLHPDMYERAVLRKTAGKSFGANVDLWSIGVTLYHVATGLLPFRPHGGRRNKETMYRITTEKQPGVISGVQTTDNGAIDWAKELPPTCQLSLGLRKLVTPLLGGLLEVDPERGWKFDRFFSEVTGLLARKRVYIFHLNKVMPLTVYIQPEHKYEQLQGLVQEQTDVSANYQLLLFNDSPFSKLIYNVDSSPASSFPTTTPHSPAMLFSTHDQDIALTLPKTPSLKFPSFPNVLSVDQDALTGKGICSAGHAVCRVVRHHATCVALIHQAVHTFRSELVSEVKEMVSQSERSRLATKAASDSFTQLVTHHRRFLATCLAACPSTSRNNPHQLSPTAPNNIALEAARADGGEEPESFVHVDNTAHVRQEGESSQVLPRRQGLSKSSLLRSSREELDNRSNISASVDGIAALRDRLEDLVNNIVDDEKKVRQSMDNLSGVIGQLENRLVEGNMLQDTWRQHESTINAACHITTTAVGGSKGKGGGASSGVMAPPLTAPAVSLTPASMHGGSNGESAVDAMAKTPAIAAALVAKLKDSWQHLLRDRAARALTFNDEQFHLLEKLKMKETAKSLECLLSSCAATLHAATDGLADWCKVAQVQRVQASIALSDLSKHRIHLSNLRGLLASNQDRYHADANTLLNAVQDIAATAAQGCVVPESPAAVESSSPATSPGEAPPATPHTTTRTARRHSDRSTTNRIITENLKQTREKQVATMLLVREGQALAAELLRTCLPPAHQS